MKNWSFPVISRVSKRVINRAYLQPDDSLLSAEMLVVLIRTVNFCLGSLANLKKKKTTTIIMISDLKLQSAPGKNIGIFLIFLQL